MPVLAQARYNSTISRQFSRKQETLSPFCRPRLSRRCESLLTRWFNWLKVRDENLSLNAVLRGYFTEFTLSISPRFNHKAFPILLVRYFSGLVSVAVVLASCFLGALNISCG